jgi:hypothetical protein
MALPGRHSPACKLRVMSTLICRYSGLNAGLDAGAAAATRAAKRDDADSGMTRLQHKPPSASIEP